MEQESNIIITKSRLPTFTIVGPSSFVQKFSTGMIPSECRIHDIRDAMFPTERPQFLSVVANFIQLLSSLKFPLLAKTGVFPQKTLRHEYHEYG